MMNLSINTRRKHKKELKLANLFKNENGAIDLSSIMVGIIVIGLIAGTIAATVFTVIPWSQDNAAKQQLDSIAAAESAYMGLSSANPSPLPAGYALNSFGNSAQLAAANLMSVGSNYCVVTPVDGKSYTGYSKSSSGNVWFMTDKKTKPELLNDSTNTVPAECGFTGTTAPTTPPVAYIDPSPTKTILTFKCDTTTTGRIPMDTNLTGTETWNDGTPARSYNNASLATAKSLTAGVTYTLTFDGTYKKFDLRTDLTTRNWASCLRSVDHWGSQTGVTSAYYAFAWASNLTDVPDHIPTTITTMENMFSNATIFNDPSVSQWDTSNVTNMTYTFGAAPAFNQPLNGWKTSNVTTMAQMFVQSTAFNQPLDNWDTSKVTSMYAMFSNATVFNQPLNTWNTSSVTNMDRMFYYATAFNQPLDKWDVSKVITMSYMFGYTPNMYNDLSKWNTISLTNGTYFRFGSKMTAAYSPLRTS